MNTSSSSIRQVSLFLTGLLCGFLLCAFGMTWTPDTPGNGSPKSTPSSEIGSTARASFTPSATAVATTSSSTQSSLTECSVTTQEAYRIVCDGSGKADREPCSLVPVLVRGSTSPATTAGTR